MVVWSGEATRSSREKVEGSVFISQRIAPPSCPRRRCRPGSGSAGADLPWRRTRDPWAVLVSEVMLQQTQVDRVVPRWHRFLERFPTVQACRDGGAGAVVEEWAGLGYNRRALEPVALRAGRLSSSTGARSLTSWTGCWRCPASGPTPPGRCSRSPSSATSAWSTPTSAGCWPAGPAGVSPCGRCRPRPTRSSRPAAGWAHNQAMLDLGATVCVARRPVCERCPLRATCAWGRSGWHGADPAVRIGWRLGRPVPLRRLRPPGPGPPGGGVASCGPVASADLAAVMGWPSEPDRADRPSPPRSSPTASPCSLHDSYQLP